MNIVEFIKFALPEYQILHSARLYGLFRLREKKRAIPDQHVASYYDHAVLVPIHPKHRSKSALSDFIIFLFIMGYPLYFITMTPFRFTELISAVYESGYAVIQSGYILVSIIFVIPLVGFSFLYTPTRRMYYRMPWILPYMALFSINIIILGIAHYIINEGFSILEQDRTTLYSLLMYGQLLLSRLFISILLYKKPITHWGGAL